MPKLILFINCAGLHEKIVFNQGILGVKIISAPKNMQEIFSRGIKNKNAQRTTVKNSDILFVNKSLSFSKQHKSIPKMLAKAMLETNNEANNATHVITRNMFLFFNLFFNKEQQ